MNSNTSSNNSESSDNAPGKVLLGVIDLVEAKRLRNVLAERGVVLELISNPATCSSGKCGTSVEVYVDAEQVAQFRAFIAAERAIVLEGLGARPELHDEVFDSEKENAICPACGTEFSTRSVECPDCGLGFVSPES